MFPLSMCKVCEILPQKAPARIVLESLTSCDRQLTHSRNNIGMLYEPRLKIRLANDNMYITVPCIKYSQPILSVYCYKLVTWSNEAFYKEDPQEVVHE